jgi:hypothetical protein
LQHQPDIGLLGVDGRELEVGRVTVFRGSAI